jgi:hypothetical protein
MPDEMSVQSLTTCEVAQGGRRVRMNFNDVLGRPASLVLPTDCVHQLIMTLPRLLSKALKMETSDDSVRAVFSLGGWGLEQAAEVEAFILTLRTTDGFDVAFSASALDLANMASSFEQLSSQATQVGEPSPPEGSSSKPVIRKHLT